MTQNYFVVISDIGIVVAKTHSAGFRQYDAVRRMTGGDVYLNEYAVALKDLDKFICDGVEAFRDMTPVRELHWRRQGAI